MLQAQSVVGGDHALAVDVEAGQGLGVGTGGEHEVLAGVRRVADGDLAGTAHASRPLDHGDAAALDESGQPLVEPGDHPVLVAVDAAHVDALEAREHAELLGLAGVVGDLGGVQECLRRDAADVQAGAAELVPLDQSDAEPELCCAQGTGIASRARTEDEYVEFGVGHAGPSLSGRPIFALLAQRVTGGSGDIASGHRAD